MENEPQAIGHLKEKLLNVSVLRSSKERLEEELKQVNQQLEKESLYCARWMTDHGIRSVKLEGVGLCEYGQSIYPKVVDEVALHTALRELGAESLLKLTIHYQSLRGFVKERLEQNLPLPSGVETYTKEYVKIKSQGGQ